MATEASSGKALPVLSGVVIGALAYAGLMVWFGLPFVPSVEDLPNVLKQPPASETAAVAIAPAAPTDPGEQVFTTVCAACHQANAQGLPGAFPPLAGSEWVQGTPEIPIRIVLRGLSGPVTVKGGNFNSMMPPPPGLDDAKIAHVLTYVRSHFDNKAEPVTTEQVAAIRASIESRTKPFTIDELKVLQTGAGGGAAGAAAAAAAAGAAATGAAGGAAKP